MASARPSASGRFGVQPLPWPAAAPAESASLVGPALVPSHTSTEGDELEDAAIFRPLDNSLAAQADDVSSLTYARHVKRGEHAPHPLTRTQMSLTTSLDSDPGSAAYYADNVYIAEPMSTTVTTSEEETTPSMVTASTTTTATAAATTAIPREGKRRHDRRDRDSTRPSRDDRGEKDPQRQRQRRSRDDEPEPQTRAMAKLAASAHRHGGGDVSHEARQRNKASRTRAGPFRKASVPTTTVIDPLGPLLLDDTLLQGMHRPSREAAAGRTESDLHALLEENRGVPGAPVGGIVPPGVGTSSSVARSRRYPAYGPEESDSATLRAGGDARDSPLSPQQPYAVPSPSHSTEDRHWSLGRERDGSLEPMRRPPGTPPRSGDRHPSYQSQEDRSPFAINGAIRTRPSPSPTHSATARSSPSARTSPTSLERGTFLPSRTDAGFAQFVREQQKARAAQRQRPSATAQRPTPPQHRRRTDERRPHPQEGGRRKASSHLRNPEPPLSRPAHTDVHAPSSVLYSSSSSSSSEEKEGIPDPRSTNRRHTPQPHSPRTSPASRNPYARRAQPSPRSSSDKSSHRAAPLDSSSIPSPSPRQGPRTRSVHRRTPAAEASAQRGGRASQSRRPISIVRNDDDDDDDDTAAAEIEAYHEEDHFTDEYDERDVARAGNARSQRASSARQQQPHDIGESSTRKSGDAQSARREAGRRGSVEGRTPVPQRRSKARSTETHRHLKNYHDGDAAYPERHEHETEAEKDVVQEGRSQMRSRSPRDNHFTKSRPASPTSLANRSRGGIIAVRATTPPTSSTPSRQRSPHASPVSASAPLTRRATEEALLSALARRHPSRSPTSPATVSPHTRALSVLKRGWSMKPYGGEDVDDEADAWDSEEDGPEGPRQRLYSRKHVAALSADLAAARVQRESDEHRLQQLRCSLVAAYCLLGEMKKSSPPHSAEVLSPALEDTLQRAARRAAHATATTHRAIATEASAQRQPAAEAVQAFVETVSAPVMAPSRFTSSLKEGALPLSLPFPPNLSLTTAAPFTGTMDVHTSALKATHAEDTAESMPVQAPHEASPEHHRRRWRFGRSSSRSRSPAESTTPPTAAASTKRKPWRTCFVVADDRGLLVFPDASAYAAHRYDRLLGYFPFSSMSLFVPDLLADPGDVVVDALAGGSNSMQGGAASPFLPSRRRAENGQDALSHSYRDMLAGLVERYHLTNPQRYYLGFLPKGASGSLFVDRSVRASLPPPVLLRVDSLEAHQRWGNFLASRFNRHLYQRLFPPTASAVKGTPVSAAAAAQGVTEPLAPEDMYDQLAKACQTDRVEPLADSGATAAPASMPSGKKTSVMLQAGNPFLKPSHTFVSSADKAAAQVNHKGGKIGGSSSKLKKGKKGSTTTPPVEDSSPHTASPTASSSSSASPKGKNDSPRYRESTLEDGAGTSDDKKAIATVKGFDPHHRDTTLAELRTLLEQKNVSLQRVHARHDTLQARADDAERRCLTLREEKERLADRLDDLSARYAALQKAEAVQHAELTRLRSIADSSTAATNDVDKDRAHGGSGTKPLTDVSVTLAQERAVWGAERRALEERNRLLAAEVVDLRAHRTDSLRALAARAVDDLDAFHAGVLGSVEEYLMGLDRSGPPGGRVPRLPARDQDHNHHPSLTASSPQGSADAENHAGSNSDNRNGSSSSSTAKGIAMLLITYDSALRLLDCCLTVDESEAKLLHSGPTDPHTGRAWALRHYGSDAELRVEMGIVKVRPLQPWEQPRDGLIPPSLSSSLADGALTTAVHGDGSNAGEEVERVVRQQLARSPRSLVSPTPPPPRRLSGPQKGSKMQRSHSTAAVKERWRI